MSLQCSSSLFQTYFVLELNDFFETISLSTINDLMFCRRCLQITFLEGTPKISPNLVQTKNVRQAKVEDRYQITNSHRKKLHRMN